jgi:hypothetical protein
VGIWKRKGDGGSGERPVSGTENTIGVSPSQIVSVSPDSQATTRKPKRRNADPSLWGNKVLGADDFAPDPPRAGWRRPVLIVGLLALASGLGTAGFLYWRSRQGASSAAPARTAAATAPPAAPPVAAPTAAVDKPAAAAEKPAVAADKPAPIAEKPAPVAAAPPPAPKATESAHSKKAISKHASSKRHHSKASKKHQSHAKASRD